MSSPSDVRVSHSVLVRVLASRILKAVGLAVVALLVGYVLISATLVRVVPSTSGTGAVIVKNNTYPGGTIPAGATILVDTKREVHTDALSRIKQSFVPSNTYAIMEVVAGPTGKLHWQAPDYLTIDEEPAPLPLSAVDGESPLRGKQYDAYLQNDYIGLCKLGACDSEQMLIINKSQVVGTVVGVK